MMYNDFLEDGIPIFALWPIENGACGCGDPDCEAVGKHPRASNWQHTPIWSEEQVEVMEEMGQLATGYGVLVTGSLLVVDIDARNGGVESFRKLLEDVPQIAGAGLVVNTGSGGGSQHLYFRAPQGALMQHHNDYPGIDFKSTGYVVGPGSLHASGNRYEVASGSLADLEEPPAALVALLKKPDRHRATHDGETVDVSDADLASMLAAINPDCDHEQWYRCGMAIHHVTGGTGFAIWDDWSAKGDKYPGQEALDKRWQSFGKSSTLVTYGTLKHYAEAAGWKEPVEFKDNTDWGDIPEPGLDSEGIDLLSPPGFVGELARWIDRRNRHPRKHLAVAAALSTISSVAGMRYTDPLDGISPNLFAFGVAGSATGKESILNSYQELLIAAGVAPALHGGIKSEQEIFRNLIRHQAALYAIDELGEQLAKILNARKKGTSSYLEGVIGQLMSIYSKANSAALVTGDLKEEIRKSLQAELAAVKKEGGDPRKEERLVRALNDVDNGIQNPYLCIFGLTTPERFEALMDYDMAASGFLGRSLIFRELDDNPRTRKRGTVIRGDVPPDIAAKLSVLYAGGHSELPGRVERIGERQEVPTTNEAEALLDEAVSYFEDMADEQQRNGMTAIPRRGYELLAKVSMLLAIPSGLRTAEHVRWAFAMVKHDIETKVKMAYSNSAEDKQDALLVKIMSHVSKDHGVTLGVLANKCRKYAKADVERAADMLAANGRLKVEQVKANRAGGMTKKYFTA